MGDILTGLEGYWGFDESSGLIAVDSSGHGRNGSLVNMEGDERGPGKIGNCLLFDGINEYVNVPHNTAFDLTASFAISLWVWGISTTNSTFISKFGTGPTVGWLFYLYSTANTMRFYTLGDAGFTHFFDFRGAWHHLVYTQDGTNRRFYIDKNNVKTALGSPVAASTESVQIGGDDEGVRFGNFYLDDVRIYSRDLVQADVNDLFDYVGDVGNWPLLNQRNRLAYNGSQLR